MNNSAQLIRACINGDRPSQNQLYREHAAKMFGVCLRYSKNREEAEEILQEGFVQVFRSLHKYKYSGSFEGWIRKIMVNCAIQQYRARPKLHSITGITGAELQEAVEEDITAGLQHKDLLKIVQSLPPGYRIVFNLHVFEGLKHREIAEALGISEGTSKSNFYDARVLLKRSLQESTKIAENYG